MRFISGLVIGAILIVGAASIHDASIDPQARPLVNWDVASGVTRGTADWLRGQAGWIGEQLHRPG